MSIESVTEVFDSRSASINRLYQRTYTRCFEVVTSDTLVGGKAVRTATGIPQIGNYYRNGDNPYDPLYEFDSGCFCAEVAADCIGGAEGGGFAWKVTCNYSVYDPLDIDPTLWKLRVVFGGERTEKVVDFDRGGAPIRNSTGDRYSDPVTIDDHITTMTITRNELVSSFDPELASQFSDTINDATWNGITKGWCKMGIIATGEPTYDSNTQRYFYTVTYPVSIGRKPWRKDLMDQGYNVLTGSPPKPTPYMVNGQPVSDPIPLDGAGNWIGVSGSPVTTTYEVFEEKDWSDLHIDLSLRLGA